MTDGQLVKLILFNGEKKRFTLDKWPQRNHHWRFRDNNPIKDVHYLEQKFVLVDDDGDELEISDSIDAEDLKQIFPFKPIEIYSSHLKYNIFKCKRCKKCEFKEEKVCKNYICDYCLEHPDAEINDQEIEPLETESLLEAVKIIDRLKQMLSGVSLPTFNVRDDVDFLNQNYEEITTGIAKGDKKKTETLIQRSLDTARFAKESSITAIQVVHDGAVAIAESINAAVEAAMEAKELTKPIAELILKVMEASVNLVNSTKSVATNVTKAEFETMKTALIATVHAKLSNPFEGENSNGNEPPRTVITPRNSPPRTSSSENSPPKIFSIKSSPIKYNSIKNIPIKTSPLKTSPQTTSPRKISPLKTSLRKISPLKTSPLKTSPLKTSPLKTSPLKLSPLKLSPLKLSPLKLSPLKLTPLENIPPHE